MGKAATSHPNGGKKATLSDVARLHYGEGLTQGRIAKRMKVSRATIANMLRDGRDLGIVEIQVDGRNLSGSTLSRQLRDKFGLEDVYIAQAEADRKLSQGQTLAHLGRVASAALLDVVSPGDRAGVAWGETIMAVADDMPKSPVADVEVCQLIGSMISDRVPASENCTIQIAGKLVDECFTLHAPALISNADIANQLRAEPTIKSQLVRLRAAGVATEAELSAVREVGAAGIVCCHYVNSDGTEINLHPSDRVVVARVNTCVHLPSVFSSFVERINEMPRSRLSAANLWRTYVCTPPWETH